MLKLVKIYAGANLDQLSKALSNYDLLQQPVEKPVWLESITAIPTESFSESYLEPESVESSGEYARRCGQDNFHIETDNGNLESLWSQHGIFGSEHIPLEGTKGHIRL